MHCKAFRRLKHKTQVFVAPEGDHYRTRLTHTLEVTQISRTVARALRLNEDLVEAIGLGHDLGHPPFGHIGEDGARRAACASASARGFRHYEHSLRVVDVLERDGAGLNLTDDVRDGIARPLRAARRCRATLEGRIVRLVDRVAYINHDIDDALRAGVLDARTTCRPSRSRCSATPARSGSTRSSTTSSSTPSAPATSSRASEAGAAMDALRDVHVRARLPRPGARGASTRRSSASSRTLFDHYAEDPDAAPRRRRRAGRRPGPARDRLPRRA